MGSRLSGTLAILCMDRFERSYVHLQMRPSFYGRYIDDIGTIIDNELVARENLQRMNQEHKTIKFEMELPGEDGFLPLLDTQIKINERGEVERKLFSKAARIVQHPASANNPTSFTWQPAPYAARSTLE